MKLSVMIHNPLTEKDSVLTVTLMDDANVSDVLQASGCTVANFSRYYLYSNKLCL